MIDIKKHLTSTIRYYSLFRFTFKFNFYVQVALPDFYRSLDRAIKSNLQKAIGNKFIGNSFFPNSCTFTITSNVSDVLEVTKDYNNKLIFEYAEFSDQQDLYPDTDRITVAFAVILKSCLDVIKQYASNQPKNILVDLEFEFSTNANTYYSSSGNIWGIQIVQRPIEIRGGAKFNEVLDSKTAPIGILEKFFQQYVYYTINRFLSINIDKKNAPITWDKIFK